MSVITNSHLRSYGPYNTQNIYFLTPASVTLSKCPPQLTVLHDNDFAWILRLFLFSTFVIPIQCGLWGDVGVDCGRVCVWTMEWRGCGLWGGADVDCGEVWVWTVEWWGCWLWSGASDVQKFTAVRAQPIDLDAPMCCLSLVIIYRIPPPKKMFLWCPDPLPCRPSHSSRNWLVHWVCTILDKDEKSPDMYARYVLLRSWTVENLKRADRTISCWDKCWLLVEAFEPTFSYIRY